MGGPTRGARSKPDIRPVLRYTAATCAAFFTLLILVAQVGTASGADDEPDLMQTLVRTVEGSIRAFVASKKQAEILTLRKEIVEFVKEQIDYALEEWGYHLLDLQINDITFDKAIIESMSRVVASNNLKAAAEK